jgi:hypothetical protein
MATGKPVGLMYVELSLDATKYTAAQKAILAGAQKNSADINKVFKTVGTQSDEMYNAMRQNIQNSLNAITVSHLTSSNEIRRATEAASIKIQSINEQQFGKHISLIDKLKKNWMAASAAAVGALAAISKAMDYMREGANALQVESAFEIMAEAAEVNSERMIENMKAATRETIDDSDLMQKAVKLMTLGYDPSQIERFSQVVITASQLAGTTAAEAYDQLGDAIANRMPKALVRMGAVTREQMKIVNEAIEAGADSTALYELAMANLELKQKKLQGTQDATTVAMQKFDAEVKGFKENIGKGLIAILGTGYRAFQILAASVLYAWGALSKFASFVEDYLGTEERSIKYREDANVAWAAADGLMDKAADSLLNESKIEDRASKQDIDNAQAKVDSQLKELKAIHDSVEAKKKAAKQAEEYDKAIIKSLEELDKIQDSVIKSDEDGNRKSLKNKTDFLAKRIELEKKAGEEMAKNAYLGYEFATEEYIKQHEEISKELERSSDTMIKINKFTAEQMQTNFSDLFFNVMQGKMTSFADFMEATWASIHRAVANYVSQMVTDYLFGVERMKGAGREGGAINALIKFAGTAVSAYAGGGGGDWAAMAGSDYAAGPAFGHSGGIMGMSGQFIPRLHGGLKPDEFPAILQAGETVLPKGESQQPSNINVIISAVDAVSLTELMSRNPQAIVGPFLNALKSGGYMVDTLRSVVR